MLVEGAFRHELVRGDHGEHLVFFDFVAFVDEKLVDLAADLRADDDLMRGDDTGEYECRRGPGINVVGRGGKAGDEDEGQHSLFHGFFIAGLKQLYKTIV